MSDKTAIEFFSGIGLVHEAIKPLGWDVVLANDNCAKKVAVYRANYPDTLTSDVDVRQLNLTDVAYARLATASFPCIDLSQAGYREGIHGQKSGVVWAFLDHVAELKRRGRAPEFLLLENVPGLLSLHGGASIDALLYRIAELGYSFDLVQVDACHFLPQTRNRVFVVAVLGQKRFPAQQCIPDTYIRRYKVREVYERHPDFPWIFFSFPELPRRKVSLEDVIQPVPRSDLSWWGKEKMDYFWRFLEHHHNTKLRDVCDSGVTKHFTATRRLRRRGVREQIINIRWDGVASCLRTPGGGSSTQLIVEVNEGVVRVRSMLGIEAARLQGVCLLDSSPDYILPPTETERRQGFGDAICVPAVRWVVEHSIERVLSDGGEAVQSQATPHQSILELDFA